MKNSAENPSKVFASRGQVTAALERAAQRARVIAEQTGTQLIVVPGRDDAPVRHRSKTSKLT